MRSHASAGSFFLRCWSLVRVASSVFCKGSGVGVAFLYVGLICRTIGRGVGYSRVPPSVDEDGVLSVDCFAESVRRASSCHFVFVRCPVGFCFFQRRAVGTYGLLWQVCQWSVVALLRVLLRGEPRDAGDIVLTGTWSAHVYGFRFSAPGYAREATSNERCGQESLPLYRSNVRTGRNVRVLFDEVFVVCGEGDAVGGPLCSKNFFRMATRGVGYLRRCAHAYLVDGGRPTVNRSAVHAMDVVLCVSQWWDRRSPSFVGRREVVNRAVNVVVRVVARGRRHSVSKNDRGAVPGCLLIQHVASGTRLWISSDGYRFFVCSEGSSCRLVWLSER